MRQLGLAFVSALTFLMVFATTVAANSHPAVTAPPQTGTGSAVVHAAQGTVLALVAVAALLVFVSIRQWRRA